MNLLVKRTSQVKGEFVERLFQECATDLVPHSIAPMASGGGDAKTEILVDVETSPKVAVVNGEPAAAAVIKSDYAAIPEGGGEGMKPFRHCNGENPWL